MIENILLGIGVVVLFFYFLYASLIKKKNRLQESVSGIDISNVHDILLEINGIGEKRAEQIVEKISNSL